MQAIVSTGYIDEWKKSIAGINPIDLVIGMAMPEFDGNIIHFPIAGKKKIKDGDVGAPIIKYQSIDDRVEKIVDLSLKYANLKLKESKDKKIAIIFQFCNYPALRIKRVSNWASILPPPFIVYGALGQASSLTSFGFALACSDLPMCLCVKG